MLFSRLFQSIYVTELFRLSRILLPMWQTDFSAVVTDGHWIKEVGGIRISGPTVVQQRHTRRLWICHGANIWFNNVAVEPSEMIVITLDANSLARLLVCSTLSSLQSVDSWPGDWSINYYMLISTFIRVFDRLSVRPSVHPSVGYADSVSSLKILTCLYFFLTVHPYQLED